MSGPSNTEKQAQQEQLQVSQQESALLGTLNQEAQSIFKTTESGLGTAENFYTALASGDPNKIAQALAPSLQQVGTQFSAAKKNLMASTPAGGELQLALAELPLKEAQTTAGLTASAVAGAPSELATLALKGTSATTSLTGAATGAGGLSVTGSQAAAEEAAQQKATTMGLLASGAELGGTLIAGG